VDGPAAALLLSDSTALDELLASAAGTSTLALTSALFARAAAPTRPVPDRIRDYRKAVPVLLREGEVDRALDGLAFLDEQASGGMGTTEFIEFLSDAGNYSPAWTTEEATEARARMFESEGRFAEAVDLLERLAYRILSQDESYAVDRAELIVGHIAAFGDEFKDVVSRLSGRVDGKRASTESDSDIEGLSKDLDFRILVVGGDERQARMDQDIIDRIHETFPKVQVEFLHTGWSGNWIKYADEFERRVRSVDGVVVLSLIRTNLGFTVRQNCPVPWRGCRGKGQGQIVEAIKRLLPLVVSHKSQERCELLTR
jgi:hypothetical protein